MPERHVRVRLLCLSLTLAACGAKAVAPTPPAPAPAPPAEPPVAPVVKVEAEAPPPPKKVWCAKPRQAYQLFADGGGVVVCEQQASYEETKVSDECARFDLKGGAPVDTARPTAPSFPHATVKADEVCGSAGCKKLKPKLLAEIAQAKAGKFGNHEPMLDATLDGRIVVVSGRAWNAATDQPLGMNGPGHYARARRGTQTSSTVIGSLLVNDWFDCAGPCHEVQITTSGGKPLGAPLVGYPGVWRASADLAVVTSTGNPAGTDHNIGGELVVLDVATGARRLTLKPPPPGVGAAVSLDATSIIVMLDAIDASSAEYHKTTARGYLLRRIDFAKKPVATDWPVPTCADD